MNYGEVIRRAFTIARHRRNLWFFGFFAGGTAGGGCQGNVPTGGGDGGTGDLGQFLADNIGVLVAIGIGVLVLVLVVVVLSLISQAGLANSVAAIDRGEERDFGTTFRAGVERFWRMLGLFVLLILVSIGLLLAIGAPVGLLIYAVVSGIESLGGRIVLIVLIALVGILAFVALIFILTVIGAFSIRALAVSQQPVVASLRAGYRLFRSRLGPSLLLALINFGLALAAGLVLIVALLVVALPLGIPVLILALSEAYTAAVVVGIVAGIAFLVVLFVASGAIGTFQHAFWTIAYLRLTNTPPPAPAYGAPAPQPPGYGSQPPGYGPEPPAYGAPGTA